MTKRHIFSCKQQMTITENCTYKVGYTRSGAIGLDQGRSWVDSSRKNKNDGMLYTSLARFGFSCKVLTLGQ